MKKEAKVNIASEIKKGILTILLFFIFPVIYQLPFLFIINKTNNIVKSIFLLIGELLLTIILIYFHKDKFKNRWSDFKKNKKEYIDLMVKAWVLGFIFMAISNLIINIGFNNGIAQNESDNRTIMKSLTLYAIPAMTILAPICEEITFRASFKNVFKSKLLYISITSLLFAGAHIIGNINSILDILYLIPYSSLGIAMSYVYYKTDNIFTNIFIHMTHNTISVLAIMAIL